MRVNGPLLLALGVAMAVACPRAEAASSGAGLWIANKPVPWVESNVAIDVRMGVAHGVVTQRFRNPTERAAEAVYVFPLPSGAAITAMRIEVGGETIDATIKPRPTAQAAYEAAVAGGRAAALTERERPGVYTQSIAAVPGGGEVAITLAWQARLDRKGGAWELAHPMVVGPRYVPGAATGAPTRGGGTGVDTDRAPDASRVTPPAQAGATTPFSFVLRLDDAVEVTSPSHEVQSRDEGGTRVVSLADNRGNRDLVVRWRSHAGAGVRAVVEPAARGAYIAVLIESEPATARPRRTAVSWLIAIDRSASLDGVAAGAARGVARELIGRLRDDDQLAVAILGERPRFARASAAERGRAAARVDRLGKGSGDLTAAMAITLAGLPRGTRVVLITDGLVADDTAAIKRAAAAGVTIHTVGVGGAPNRWMLEAIAARTGGTHHVVSAPEEASGLAEALATAGAPLPITVDWKKPTVSDPEPARALAFPGGATLIVALDPRGVPSGEVEVALGSRRLRAPIVRVGGNALATEWARQRVARLWAGGEHDAATALAVERGIVSPTTALVAVGSRAGEAVRSTVTVPVPLPAGVRREAITRNAGDVDDVSLPPGTHTVITDSEPESGADRAGSGGGGTSAPEPMAPPRDDADEEGEAVYALGSAAAERTILGRAVARRHVSVGLSLGARLDEPAPAATLSLGFHQRFTPRTELALRLELGGAPTADEPVLTTATVGLTRYAFRILALDLGAGLAWSGDLGFGYRFGLGTARGPFSIGLRLTGAITPTSNPATVGLGADAAF